MSWRAMTTLVRMIMPPRGRGRAAGGDDEQDQSERDNQVGQAVVVGAALWPSPRRPKGRGRPDGQWAAPFVEPTSPDSDAKQI
jgi:hypothetical protein